MLFHRSGQANYLFDKESTSRAECYDALPDGVAADSHAGRADGSTQVTYGGHPLYYSAHEGKYQVLCHNVTGFRRPLARRQPRRNRRRVSRPLRSRAAVAPRRRGR